MTSKKPNSHFPGTYEKILITIILICIYLLWGMSLLGFSNKSVTAKATALNISENHLLGLCYNSTLNIAAKCLIENIRPVFKYAYLGERSNVPLDELIKDGGSCKDWSEMMSRIGNSMGFETTLVSFPINKSNELQHHEIVLWADSEEYCLMDQINYHCVKFGEMPKRN